jgi:AAHS family 4-hydroxybenzoate transporter-like MFS transporter
MPTTVINILDFINSRKLYGFQISVLVLCFLVVAVDGFDTAAVGYIAPALVEQWKVTRPQLAPLFGAGLFGLMAGAFVFGPIADKVGRKACQESSELNRESLRRHQALVKMNIPQSQAVTVQM